VAAITDPINEMEEIEKLLAEVTTGTIILDADDPRCPELMSFEKMPRVCLVSQDAANETVARHIQSGGDGVRLELDGEDTWIVIHRHGESMRLFPSRDLPDAPDETILRAAMMAAAMAVALGIETDLIKSGLRAPPAPP